MPFSSTTTSRDGFGHQDNVSLIPMMASIEEARKLSWIMRTLLLLSSNTAYSEFEHFRLPEREIIEHTSVDPYVSQRGPKSK